MMERWTLKYYNNKIIASSMDFIDARISRTFYIRYTKDIEGDAQFVIALLNLGCSFGRFKQSLLDRNLTYKEERILDDYGTSIDYFILRRKDG